MAHGVSLASTKAPQQRCHGVVALAVHARFQTRSPTTITTAHTGRVLNSVGHGLSRAPQMGETVPDPHDPVTWQQAIADALGLTVVGEAGLLDDVLANALKKHGHTVIAFKSERTPVEEVDYLRERLAHYMSEVERERVECGRETADLSKKITNLIIAGDKLESALRRAVRDLSGLVIDPLLGVKNRGPVEEWAEAKKAAST